jgi:uncharacterized protein YndB with AHSA1/START domain
MEEQSVIHSTFVIERNLAASPERVFAAFADPAKKRRWFAEGESHDVVHYEMDFRVGGKELSRFRLKEGTPMKGATFTNDTVFQNIVPNRRVVFAYTMSLCGPRAMQDKCISASLVTAESLASETGTTLIFTHQAAFFEGADGPAMRQAGWGKILDRFAKEFQS